MARLLVLAPLCVLLALPPACRSLSCYQCSDLKDSTELADLNTVFRTVIAKLSGLPSCFKFSRYESRFLVDCGGLLGMTKASCAKVSVKGHTFRGCLPATPFEGCKTADVVTTCVCTDKYCNSAGPPTPTLLLLLLAALVAGLLTVW